MSEEKKDEMTITPEDMGSADILGLGSEKPKAKKGPRTCWICGTEMVPDENEDEKSWYCACGEKMTHRLEKEPQPDGRTAYFVVLNCINPDCEEEEKEKTVCYGLENPKIAAFLICPNQDKHPEDRPKGIVKVKLPDSEYP